MPAVYMVVTFVPSRVTEEYRLRVLEGRVTRKMFGPKREEMTGDWIEYHNENLHDFYSTKQCSDDQIKKDMMRGAWGTCKGEEISLQPFRGEA
jgi:hypothetical protein